MSLGDILWYRFEGLKLRLADNTFYTPDFAVMAADGVMECHEVKGFWRDDARAKIKIAAEQYPFRFKAVSQARSQEAWRRRGQRSGSDECETTTIAPNSKLAA
jgi:hypothetical protein